MSRMAWADFVVPVMLATAVVLLPMLVRRHGNGSRVIVIFGPWTTSADALTRAAASGSRLIGVGRLPNVVIASPETELFESRVRRAGAWMVIDDSSDAGCAVKNGGAG